MAVVLGVDSSTQATKVEVRDADTGALLSAGRAPHPVTTPPRSEQDPDAWWAAYEAAYAAAAPASVGAVAVAAQQHGMVALDRTLTVCHPAKLWNDTESARDAAALLGAYGGPARWAAACGSVPVASFTVTKVAWLRRVHPELFARVARVVLPHDWLTFRLTGAFVTDRGDASGTGYWSPRDDAYVGELLALVGLDETMVPRVLGPREPAGAHGAAVVAPGTGDNMAGALGLGLRLGDLAVSLGTSGTAFSRSPVPTNDPTGAVAGFADAAGGFLPLVCTLNCTKVTDAVARLLRVTPPELDELALAAPPGAGGLVLVPYLDGERTPNRPDATGLLAGLRSDVSREQLARAAVEGVVCGLLEAVDALGAAGVSTTGRLVLAGGGARSAAYRRVLADLSQRPVVVPGTGEPVATGACVQAASVLQGASTDEIAAAWGLGGGVVVEPDPRVETGPVRAAYASARDR